MPNNNNTLFCFRCYHTWKKRKSPNPKSCPRCRSPYWNRPRKRVSKGIVLKMKDMIVGIHNKIIELSGGERGIRDDGGIYNSTYKLLNHQYRNQRRPTSIGAFALDEFAKRHYFIDGNKRTAYAIAKIFMLINKCHLKIQYREATNFILEVAKFDTKINFEEIKRWLDNQCEIIEEKDVENYLNKTFVNITLGDEENGRH
ncbi:MAG: type II toxin-antitoxin system death-on-curing family toxin [Candidatus Pacearchaeota archaeon]|nr:type II toxin-antitoxin system death-on-curing family toxin [Candidatus Pacearchaeota archaeon]